jgi:hypothetical protein
LTTHLSGRRAVVLKGSQDDILTDLADAVPGNDHLLVLEKQAAEASGGGGHQGGNTACFWVKFEIHRRAQVRTGAGVNDIFLPKFTKPHAASSFLIWIAYGRCSERMIMQICLALNSYSLCEKIRKYTGRFLDISENDQV